MYLSLHLPSLPLEALLRHQPEKRHHPCAVAATEKTDKAVPILALNRRAAAFNLEPGFSITRALARCPQLLVLPRDPEAEALALHDLLEVAESRTPDFELTTPDTLTLDLHNCGDRGDHCGVDLRSTHLKHETTPSTTPHPTFSPFHSRVASLGLPVQLATGPTPDLAHLLSLSPTTSQRLTFRGPSSRWSHGAHQVDPLCDVPQSVFHSLSILLARNLPSLHLSPSTIKLLELWGIHTLGDLASLPQQGLHERLGPALAQLHDILHAKAHRPLLFMQPVESFVSTIDLEHSIESSTALIFILRKYLQNLCNHLYSRYLKCVKIHLELSHSNERLNQIFISLPEPSCVPEILLAPLQARLESLQLTAPIDRFKLTLTPGESSAGQHQLFDHSIRQPHRLSDTLIRLSALLGDDRVGFPIPHFSHRPDTFHLAPAQSLFTRGCPGPGQAVDAAARGIPNPTQRRPASHSSTSHFPLSTFYSREAGPPLSRFRPPLTISVAFDPPKRGHPQPLALLTGPHRGRIRRFHGPFPISGHWWSPTDAWQQLEWDIELETHHLLRLSHTPPDRWLLEGHYA